MLSIVTIVPDIHTSDYQMVKTENEEVIRLCNKLRLSTPYKHLIDLPIDEQGQSKPIAAASLILLEKIDDEYYVILEHRNWPKGTHSPPGGYRATEKQTQWDIRDPPSQEQIAIEKVNPLVTAAREAGEEVGAIFNPVLAKEISDLLTMLQKKRKSVPLNSEEIKQIKMSLEEKENKMTRLVYRFLNQEDTQVLQIWEEIGLIFMYVTPCTKEITERINKGPIIGDEVLGITRVALSALADMPRHGAKPTVKTLNGDNIILTDYTAKSIFDNFEAIATMAENWYEQDRKLEALRPA